MTPVRDPFIEIEVREGYEGLSRVLTDALDQAQFGKGAQRHNGTGLQPFEQQPVLEITRRVGLGFPLGQAMKKIIESERGGLDPLDRRKELYGAIIYLAAAILHTEESSVDRLTGNDFNPEA